MGSARYTMYRVVKMPWIVGVNIPWVGGLYTMGRVGQYTMGRRIDIP